MAEAPSTPSADSPCPQKWQRVVPVAQKASNLKPRPRQSSSSARGMGRFRYSTAVEAPNEDAIKGLSVSVSGH